MSEGAVEAGRAERIAEHRVKEGFRPKIEAGDVELKYEGNTLWVMLSEKDAAYYRVMCFGIWPTESEAERMAAYRAASEVGKGTKGVKIFLDDDNVTASVDMLVPDVESLLKVLVRGIELCGAGVARFGNAVQRIMEDADRDGAGEETDPEKL